MKKIYRHVKFYIKSAFKNLKRHFGMTFSAISAISITLILISIFSLLSVNLSNVTYHIEDQLTIRVSIDKIVTKEEQKQLQEQIEKLDGVKQVSFHSGDEELEAYKKEYADGEELFSMYEGKTNPIRDAFVVEVKTANDINAVNEAISMMKGIVETGYGGDATLQMIDAFSTIRDGSIVFIIFLVLIAAFLISNKIKMSIYTRREEIAVMRNVGASNWFIKAPMMLEGMLIGFFGAVAPVLITIFGYQYIYQKLDGILLSNMFLMKPVFPITIQLSLGIAGIGILVGLVGSFLSTTKNLRWKR